MLSGTPSNITSYRSREGSADARLEKEERAMSYPRCGICQVYVQAGVDHSVDVRTVLENIIEGQNEPQTPFLRLINGGQTQDFPIPETPAPWWERNELVTIPLAAGAVQGGTTFELGYQYYGPDPQGGGNYQLRLMLQPMTRIDV